MRFWHDLGHQPLAACDDRQFVETDYDLTAVDSPRKAPSFSLLFTWDRREYRTGSTFSTVCCIEWIDSVEIGRHISRDEAEEAGYGRDQASGLR